MTELTKFYQAAGWTEFRDWLIDQIQYGDFFISDEDSEILEQILRSPQKYQDEIDSWVESKAVPE